ncbi:esterase-like activity of phytase family protein [Jiella sp. MQZ13P-4]|uniref:Esterase-like activity of phytase family protein n=2 Tax=Jiella sonneratiae TaxID=2816856 RepID=A0ABS3J776_9HYPH|nr:esterase-like activity of phytase family protein [Jiella sonneratiae]
MHPLVPILAGLLAAASAADARADEAPLPAPTYRGEFVVPTGLKLSGSEFGGISGLDYDPESETFYAISDDRSERAPARFYALKLALSEKGIGTLDIAATETLENADGKPFAAGAIDPEAIRIDAKRRKIYWSSEGDGAGRPQIFAAGMDGRAERSFDLPEAFLPDAGGTRGIHENLAFEGLAISPDGTTLYAMTENALVQDGDKATFEAGSRSRLLAIDLRTGKPGAEYVYETDRIPFRPKEEGGSADNGVSEMTALPDGRLVTVERSYVAGVGNHIAFYVVDPKAGEAIGEGTAAADVAPLKKTQWFKIDEGDFGGLDIDNIECLTFGPEIAGERSIVIASDNNFSRHQKTQFVLFTFKKGD